MVLKEKFAVEFQKTDLNKAKSYDQQISWCDAILRHARRVDDDGFFVLHIDNEYSRELFRHWELKCFPMGPLPLDPPPVEHQHGFYDTANMISFAKRYKDEHMLEILVLADTCGKIDLSILTDTIECFPATNSKLIVLPVRHFLPYFYYMFSR